MLDTHLNKVVGLIVDSVSTEMFDVYIEEIVDKSKVLKYYFCVYIWYCFDIWMELTQFWFEI